MDLAVKVYHASRSMPKDACGGLARLLQREAVAVPAHLAGLPAARARSRALACLEALEKELRLAEASGCLDRAQADRLAAQAGEVSGLLKKP
jgi:hypothetical protein